MNFYAVLLAVWTVALFLGRVEAAELLAMLINRFRK